MKAVRDVVGNPLQVDVPVSVPNRRSDQQHCRCFAECTANSNCSSVSQNLAKFFPINPGPDVALNLDLNNRNREDNGILKLDYHSVREKQFDRHLLHRRQRANRGRHDGG